MLVGKPTKPAVYQILVLPTVYQWLIFFPSCFKMWNIAGQMPWATSLLNIYQQPFLCLTWNSSYNICRNTIYNLDSKTIGSTALQVDLEISGSRFVMAVERRGPRCSVVSVHFHLLIKMKPNKTNNTTKTNREAQRLCALNKVNFPQRQVEKGLPKYCSQPETTIDSCPWLRTLPGQNIEIQNHRCPPQITPWPNQIET